MILVKLKRLYFDSFTSRYLLNMYSSINHFFFKALNDHLFSDTVLGSGNKTVNTVNRVPALRELPSKWERLMKINKQNNKQINENKEANQCRTSRWMTENKAE